MKYLLVVFYFFFLIGCYNRAEFTPYSYSFYTPRTTSNQIEVFTASPAERFIELGYLQSHVDSWIRMPLRNVYILKKEAASVGGDAIINYSCTPDGFGWGPAFCQGVAIRFTR
ncbi:MAG: hypothetical protein ABFD50_02650 [Smithella sp.]